MSRKRLIAVLVIAEFVILYAIFSVSGLTAPRGGWSGTALADTAPHDLAPIDAGSAPHVIVDDPDSSVTVAISPDGRVHASDEWSVHGWILGSKKRPPELHATRTLDGVEVARASQAWQFVGVIGDEVQRTQVLVPAGTRLEVRNAGGLNVSGLRGDLVANLSDGRIVLTDIVTDSIRVHTADGRIEFHGVKTRNLAASTNDGRILGEALSVEGSNPTATLQTDSGRIMLGASFAGGGTYDIHTGDGRIHLNLPRENDLAIEPNTGDGHVELDGSRRDGTFNLGAGTGTLRVATGNGDISITTNGVVE
ncbi:MAG: DUF4097 family beta strand repeat protein [Candidatus Eremiobacteraeota bacterium]|nr:DUF4097 family beta strand repeat protein [Candidatus Eremiobacteraeota bacterium]